LLVIQNKWVFLFLLSGVSHFGFAEHQSPQNLRPVVNEKSSSLTQEPASDFLELKKIILEGISPEKDPYSHEEILELISKLSLEEKEELLLLVEKKKSQANSDLFYQDTLSFIQIALKHYPEWFMASLDVLSAERKVIQNELSQTPFSAPKISEVAATLKLLDGLVARSPVPVIALESPQNFPEAKPPAWGEPFPVFKHPSGALQLGRVEFKHPDDQKNHPRLPISPGSSFGKGVLRISLHGDGAEDTYSLLNPDAEEIPVGYLAQLRRKKVSSKDFLAFRKNLPQYLNPTEIISESCNPDLDGCSPATYAQWLQAERFPENAEPLLLKKVVMTPKGFSSMGVIENPVTRIYGDQGSFGNPYLRELVSSWTKDGASAPREYRLIRGGNPENENAWIDTGIYTDSRQASIPLIGIHGEAKEFGRHLGLSEELGGGNSLSYLDKIRLINDNPDATYFQKVRSNWARPIGSAAAFVREVCGLSCDLYYLLW